MHYAWLLTKDCLPPCPGFPTIAGVHGPKSSPLSPEEIRAHPRGQKFRLLTDDREVAAEGILVDLCGQCSGFEPQDDYGEGGLGTTIIQYWDRGWKDL
jgi:hypothetical protein